MNEKITEQFEGFRYLRMHIVKERLGLDLGINLNKSQQSWAIGGVALDFV